VVVRCDDSMPLLGVAGEFTVDVGVVDKGALKGSAGPTSTSTTITIAPHLFRGLLLSVLGMKLPQAANQLIDYLVEVG
jgi:hypothetical protein